GYLPVASNYGWNEDRTTTLTPAALPVEKLSSFEKGLSILADALQHFRVAESIRECTAAEVGCSVQKGKEVPAEKLEFVPGGFIYRQNRYDLIGQPLRLLEAFVQAKHRSLTHQQIIDLVWGDSYSPSEGRVRGLVSELRNALRELLKLTTDPLPSAGPSAC